jgi:hypothetical protein
MFVENGRAGISLANVHHSQCTFVDRLASHSRIRSYSPGEANRRSPYHKRGLHFPREIGVASTTIASFEGLHRWDRSLRRGSRP